MIPLALAVLAQCIAVDGDTIRCGDERIRLIAIDAPEMPGHCQPNRDCAPGDPFASKAALAKALTGSLTIERLGTDRYGRTVADVFSNNHSLSCMQIAAGHARYWARYDKGGRIERECQ